MLFITYASYSPAGMQGLLKKPEDRRPAIQALIEKVGGNVIAVYNTTGSNDVVVISEAPGGDDAVALSMAVGASGALTRVETVRAWDSADFTAVVEKAAGLTGVYKPPGG